MNNKTLEYNKLKAYIQIKHDNENQKDKEDMYKHG